MLGVNDVRSIYGNRYDYHLRQSLDVMPKLPSGEINWTQAIKMWGK